MRKEKILAFRRSVFHPTYEKKSHLSLGHAGLVSLVYLNSHDANYYPSAHSSSPNRLLQEAKDDMRSTMERHVYSLSLKRSKILSEQFKCVLNSVIKRFLQFESKDCIHEKNYEMKTEELPTLYS